MGALKSYSRTVMCLSAMFWTATVSCKNDSVVNESCQQSMVFDEMTTYTASSVPFRRALMVVMVERERSRDVSKQTVDASWLVISAVTWAEI